METLGKKKQNKKAFAVVFIFLLYGILIYLQNMQIYLYFDDYGYASLSYAVDAGVTGTSYNLGDILCYLGQHYMVWGGRIGPFFVEILLIKGGLWLIRLVQTLVTVIVAFYSYKIACVYQKKKEAPLLAGLLCCLYFLIPQVILKNGIYWYTASVLYFWPLALILPAIYLFIREKRRKSNTLLISVLFFLSGFTYEQMGLIPIVFVCVHMMIQLIQKQKVFTKINLVPLLCGIAGYALLMFAPGNMMRLGITEGVGLTGETFLYRMGLLFYPANYMVKWNWIPIVSMLGCLLGSIHLQRCSERKSAMTHGFTIGMGILSGMILAAYAVYPFVPKMAAYGGILNMFCALFFMLFVIFYCIQKSYLKMIPLIVAAGALQVVSLVVGVIHDRTCTMYLFITFIFIGMLVYEFWISGKRWWYNLIYAVPLAIIMCINYASIYGGYQKNVPYHEKNNQILEEVQHAYEQGEKMEPVRLYKLPEPYYAGTMPYETDIGGNMAWVLEYYGLPQTIQVQFVEETLE